MIHHVWERCRQAQHVDRVIVATEDERIREACKAFGAEVELTSPDHASGTDRIAEVSRRHEDYAGVLNVQGDEPGILPETVTAVAAALADPHHEITTAVTVTNSDDDLTNPNVVKAVCDLAGNALYFSRAGIPFQRDSNAPRPVYYRHQGIYGFQRTILQRVTQLPASPLERAESLEQLRWLQSGYKIHCVVVEGCSIGIDTPQDLQSFEKIWQSHNE